MESVDKREAAAVAASDAARMALPAPSTEGERLFREVPGSLGAIASRLGTSKASVGHWRDGRRTPDRVKRWHIEQAFGIGVSEWDRRPTVGEVAVVEIDHPAVARPPVRTPVAIAAASAQPGSIAECDALLSVLREARDSGVITADLVRLVDSENRVLATRHKMQQDAAMLEDRVVTEHPKWRRLRSAILAALSPFPAAQSAVAEAIAEVEGSR